MIKINIFYHSAAKNFDFEPVGDKKTSILAPHLGHQPTNAVFALFKYIRLYTWQHL
jgi:hypothetical protein